MTDPSAQHRGRPGFADFVRAPNIATDPALYRLENEALARDGRLDRALEALAPYAGRRLLDVGCGQGFWVERYRAAGADAVGVEPDPDLRGSEHVLAGSAEHLPFAEASFDVVHARFAYFFGPGAQAGLDEVMRVLRPGGVFLVVDNSWNGGEFAGLLKASSIGNATLDPEQTDAWWADRGAERHEVVGGWRARTPEELERILRLELPGAVVDAFVEGREPSAALDYHFAVYRVWR